MFNDLRGATGFSKGTKGELLLRKACPHGCEEKYIQVNRDGTEVTKDLYDAESLKTDIEWLSGLGVDSKDARRFILYLLKKGQEGVDKSVRI